MFSHHCEHGEAISGGGAAVGEDYRIAAFLVMTLIVTNNAKLSHPNG